MSSEFGDLSQAIDEQRKTGVLTDQWLLPKFFKLTKGTEVHLVATDSFIDKSKDQYNAAWLSRELIQNFVDHNPDDQGTLNGVDITAENLPKSKAMPNGGQRITIKGNWKFENPTGVISPHSEKPTDTETAGGNGIGLKQSALRMLRDFGAKKFEIDGEGWKVEYGMIKKDEVNRTIEDNLPEMESARVRHDWLVADLTKTDNHGTNYYVIETDNQELIAALSELPQLGVSKQNKYLQGLDLEMAADDKRSIALKWLQPKEEGRFFLNGQVMNYEKNGDSSDDYWRGPEGLSVSLKGVKYKMSIDRPPVNKYDFGRYLENFTKKLSTQQLIEQLQKSYHLWRAAAVEAYDRPGFMVVVDRLVETLQTKKDYTPGQFKELFPEKLLANDTGLEGKDAQKLEQQGYIICDKIFAKIGMETASSLLRPDETLAREKSPGNPSRKVEQLAEETGLQVYFEEYGRITTADFINKIEAFAKKYGAKMDITDGGIKLNIPDGVNTDTLYAQIPYPKKKSGQQLIFELRSLIQHGLQHELLAGHTHTSNNDVMTTYKSELSLACGDTEQVLIIRNTRIRPKQYGQEKLPLEANLAFGKNLTAEQVQSILQASDQLPETATAVGKPEKPGRSTKKTEPQTTPSPTTPHSKIIAEKPGHTTKRADLQTAPSPVALRPKITGRPEADLAYFHKPTERPEKPSWLKRALVVLGIGAVGAIGAYEASQPPGVAAASSTPDTANKNKGPNQSKLEAAPSADITADQIKKRHEANEKFAKFLNQHPDALVSGSDLGKTEITAVGKRTANVEPHSEAEGTEHTGHGQEFPDQVEDFEPLPEITPRQAEQLKVLTAYLELTTDAKLSGVKFFVFKGKGALGINHAKQFIGLHEAMFETAFFEALSTLVHEAAHCDPDANGHDNQFRHTMQDLFSAALETEHLDTNPDSKGSTFRKRWEELRSNK